MDRTRYKQSYSDFVGVDLSSDPSEVSRNRLAYAVNMWRDYESSRRGCIETFPGYRTAALIGKQINGIYNYRTKSGADYLIVHAGRDLYAFTANELAASGGVSDPTLRLVLEGKLADSDSTGYLFNNNLYILDGTKFIEVKVTVSEVGIETIEADEIVGYIPMTYYDGKPYEQRNMLSDFAYETITSFENDTEHNYSIARISDVAKNVFEVKDLASGEVIEDQFYKVNTGKIYVNDQELTVVKSVSIIENVFTEGVEIKLEIYPTHFSTIKGADNFLEGNKDYKKTGREALNGCTKCAVFDGRIFLTGNPELPNTIFYSQRNLTGASDPTYFGAYNYINDGVGNNPNVELLATPSYLMVLKNDTVQEGSIYYHTPADNTHSDQVIRNLLPRIYPSISGAAGIGSAGGTDPGATVCNFLDDPVFLSKRGLDAVGKETLNLERTVTHRSSNVDRLLVREDLAGAALAEWKGYLLILVNGNVYMADSRVVSQHADGSYQYEWFMLRGIGAWDFYYNCYRHATQWPMTESGRRLDEYKFESGELVGDKIKLQKSNEAVNVDSVVVDTVYDGDNRITLFTVEGYLVEQVDEEKVGAGAFHGANKIAVVGERLFFGTPNGYILCANTDMRDEDGIIPRDAYSFNGTAYESGCATRLDDCGQMGLAKCTLPGTVVAEFKMMPGSRCRVNVSLNGRDWKELFSGAVGSTRFDFGDLDFSNFAFTENESNITVLREMTRNFVRKQYYIYSDGYKEPFGLCGLTYQYYVKGKIRR